MRASLATVAEAPAKAARGDKNEKVSYNKDTVAHTSCKKLVSSSITTSHLFNGFVHPKVNSVCRTRP